MFFCNVVSRWAQLVSFLCRMLNVTDSDLQIQNYKNEVQLKLKLHQLGRIALWLSKLQLSVFLKGSMSLLTVACTSSLGNSFRISLTVFWLFCYCHLASPWFRFSTRTSSVAGLALYSVSFTRATSVFLFSWRERYSCSFYWALTLTLIPASRIEILIGYWTQPNRECVFRSSSAWSWRCGFFWKAFLENFSTFFSGRVRRLFSARTEFPYAPSKNWSGLCVPSYVRNVELLVTLVVVAQ